MRRRPLAAVCTVLLVLAGCSVDAPEPSPTTPGDVATRTSPATPAQPEASPTPSTPTSGTPSPGPTQEPGLGGYGVSAGHPAAVDAGMGVLADSGSAVDAAISAALVMAVVEPFSSGPGGGGATVVVPGDGRPPVAYDYTEEVWQEGTVPASGTGVPGYVAGLSLLHADHGRLPWRDLFSPAVALAEDGVEVSALLAAQLRTDLGVAATSGLGQFRPDGTPLTAGDRLVQMELADTLRLLANEGPEAFSAGPLAGRLAEVDGIDEASLAAYEVQRGDPARGPVGRYEVLAAAPPLSGAALVQLLQVAEASGVAAMEPGGADYVDALATAADVALATIATELGDPEFHDVPLDDLTDPEASAGLARQGPAAAAHRPAGSTRVDRSANTTHVSVVGPDGTAVSMTHTITGFWGSRQEVGGFFLNNHLVRFGLGRTEANRPEPGRRTTSYMSPAIVVDHRGRPVLVLGTPGGERIPSVLGAVLARRLLLGQSLEQAVRAPRFHPTGGRLLAEPLPGRVAEELGRRGHVLVPVDRQDLLFGSVQALEVDPETGQVGGVRDERREGTWAATFP